MAIKPAHRYPTPSALAEDIEHWLADEPVSAWHEPLALRSRRCVKRHAALVTSAAATVLVATAGLAVLITVVAESNQKLERVNRQLAGSNRQLATANGAALAAREDAEAQTASLREAVALNCFTRGISEYSAGRQESGILLLQQAGAMTATKSINKRHLQDVFA